MPRTARRVLRAAGVDLDAARVGSPTTVLRHLALGHLHRRDFEDLEAFCVFIGHPRSGHTIMGAFLNAHPNAVIGLEADITKVIGVPLGRRSAFSRLLAQDDLITNKLDLTKHRYRYEVPGSWQGRFRQLKVIGDNKAGATSAQLGWYPRLIDRLRRLVGVPLRVIHVVRNPYDNIARISLIPPADIDSAMASYSEICTRIDVIEDHLEPGEFLRYRHEDFVDDPRTVTRRAFGFVGLDATDQLIEACASIVWPTPNRTRDERSWTDAELDAVARIVDGHDFLAGYTFD